MHIKYAHVALCPSRTGYNLQLYGQIDERLRGVAQGHGLHGDGAHETQWLMLRLFHMGFLVAMRLSPENCELTMITNDYHSLVMRVGGCSKHGSPWLTMN